MSITNLGPFSSSRFVKSLVLEWVIESKAVEWIKQNAEIRNLSELDRSSDLWQDIKVHGRWLFLYDFNENVIYYEMRK